MAPEQGRLRIVVSGRVQGVCFRQETVDQAYRLGLRGWVRNRPDGKVEIVAEGKRPMLEMLLAWAHCGPAAARVDQVESTWIDFCNEFRHFAIR